MVIGNGNFDRLVGLWSFHTILVLIGQLDLLPNLSTK